MAIYCTAKWHQTKYSDYCVKCGERKDGRLSLAGVPFGALIIGVFTRYGNFPAIKLRLSSTTRTGSDFVQPTGELLSITMSDFHKWMIMDYCSPFQVIPMPLDADGRGPETDPTKITRTVYEIWDASCQTVGSFSVESEALAHLEKLK